MFASGSEAAACRWTSLILGSTTQRTNKASPSLRQNLARSAVMWGVPAGVRGQRYQVSTMAEMPEMADEGDVEGNVSGEGLLPSSGQVSVAAGPALPEAINRYTMRVRIDSHEWLLVGPLGAITPDGGEGEAGVQRPWGRGFVATPKVKEVASSSLQFG